MRSTTLPFPSSPHWAPTTTTLGTGGGLQDAGGHLHQAAERDRLLAASGGIEEPHLAPAEPRRVDHERVDGPDLSGIGERLAERPAHDVAADGQAAVAQPTGERERGRLVFREVDD